MRKWGVVAVAGLLVAGVAVIPLTSRAATGGLGFHKEIKMPGSDDGNEPSTALSKNGKRYVSWQSPGEFASSTDGINFTNLGEPDPNALGDVTNAVDSSGAVYNGQICGLPAALHTCIYRSTDGGHTWPQQTLAADSNPGASDRPWIDVYPHLGPAGDPDNTTVYLEYHTFSPEDLVYVTISPDGGKTFGPPIFVSSDTNATQSSLCNTIPSGITVDQSNGNVYALWLSGNDVVSNATTGCNYSQVGPFDKAWVSVSKDDGLTWHSHQVWQGAFDQTTKIGDNADKIFGTISVDRGHQPQVVLSVRHQDDPVGFVADCETNPNCQEAPHPTDLYLFTSPDQGTHWTNGFKINATTGSYFFPSAAAGSKGIVDAIYYHTASQQPNNPNDDWYTGFSQIRGATAVMRNGRAVYSATPTAAHSDLDPGVSHHGGICSFGIFCSVVPNANRNVADSIEVDLDPAGGANAAWTDDFQPKQTGSADSHIDFTCQNSGPSAFAGKPALTHCYGAG